MSRMKPCPQCDSHLRVTETACPFCGGQLASDWNAVQALPNHGRLSRAAAVAMAATVAVSGCTETVVREEPSVSPVYGAPIGPDEPRSDDRGPPKPLEETPSTLDASEGLDAGRARSDAGSAGLDAGVAPGDAGPTSFDAGASPGDAGPSSDDVGVANGDAGASA